MAARAPGRPGTGPERPGRRAALDRAGGGRGPLRRLAAHISQRRRGCRRRRQWRTSAAPAAAAAAAVLVRLQQSWSPPVRYKSIYRVNRRGLGRVAGPQEPAAGAPPITPRGFCTRKHKGLRAGTLALSPSVKGQDGLKMRRAVPPPRARVL